MTFLLKGKKRKETICVALPDDTGRLTDDDVDKFSKGFRVDEEFTALPSKLEIKKNQFGRWAIKGVIRSRNYCQ